MPVEFTSRQFQLTQPLRLLAEQGIKKIESLLGSPANAHVTFVGDQRRVRCEMRIEWKGQQIESAAEAGDGPSAVAEAVDRLERQAQKLKSRVVTQRRPRADGEKSDRSEQQKSKPAKQMRRKGAEVEAEQRPETAVTVGAAPLQTVPVVVHDFPARVRVTETHIVRSEDAVAKKKMTLEEAVKEMEFRDKDIFVFRNSSGKLNILYRTRDGRIEHMELGKE